jgi:hypothetical protein
VDLNFVYKQHFLSLVSAEAADGAERLAFEREAERCSDIIEHAKRFGTPEPVGA